MAFNGSGVFNRLYNWVADRDAAIPIDATKMDAEQDGIAAGLSNCVTKDGQTTVTANLPMAGFRHTGVGNASARTDYASAAQIQDGGLTLLTGAAAATNTTSATDYTANTSPTFTAYAEGQVFLFEPPATNLSDTVRININGVGYVTLNNIGGSMPANGLVVNSLYQIAYINSNFRVLGSVLGSNREKYIDITGDSTTATTILEGNGVEFEVFGEIGTGSASVYLQLNDGTGWTDTSGDVYGSHIAHDGSSGVAAFARTTDPGALLNYHGVDATSGNSFYAQGTVHGGDGYRYMSLVHSTYSRSSDGSFINVLSGHEYRAHVNTGVTNIRITLSAGTWTYGTWRIRQLGRTPF